MDSTPGQSGYARLRPWPARTAILSWFLVTAFCVAVSLSPLADKVLREPCPNSGDNALYRAVAARVSRGEGYYPALGAELLARGYPTRSVFNWRTPLPIWLVAKLPCRGMGQVALGLLGLSVLLLGTELTVREERGRLARVLPVAILLGAPTLLCATSEMLVMPMLWAGTLIALSACAYGLGWRRLAVAAGLAAPFFRDLALPYALLCAVLAAREHRRRELAIWAAGLLAWTVFFGLHALAVSRVMSPDARAHPQGWVQFGGTAFVVATAQMNPYLVFLPQWVAAIYFVAALFGLAGWHTPGGRRIATAAALYVLAFTVVGQKFNVYWGLLTAPLLCFGVARFPAAACDCCRAAFPGRRGA
jgi:hypothetical protein